MVRIQGIETIASRRDGRTLDGAVQWVDGWGRQVVLYAESSEAILRRYAVLTGLTAAQIAAVGDLFVPAESAA